MNLEITYRIFLCTPTPLYPHPYTTSQLEWSPPKMESEYVNICNLLDAKVNITRSLNRYIAIAE